VATLAAGSASAANPRVLVFTKTAGYRHASIPAAILAIRMLGAQNGFDVDTTEDDRVFTAANLARYDAVVFLLTTGDVLDNAEQSAFETYIRAGGSYVGVHSAADTERDWPWYGRLVGAWSSGHPEIQQAVLDVASPRDASTTPLPPRWTRTDEWYGFLTNPRSVGVRVLLSLDETTYLPREWTMGTDHPIAWSQEFDGGRAWYTAGGHTEESYSEPLFLVHLLGGIRYALDRPTAEKPSASPTSSPMLRSLAVSVRARRLAVTVRHSGCTRCQAVLRVRAKATRLKVAGGVATGTSAALPPGRWQLTVVLTDGETGLSRTARRWVQVR
jgi:type 1 glutamine amidotransferase